MAKNILNNLKKIKIVPKVYSDFPESPGIYIYFKDNKPIYVGKAVNLKRRVASYFRLDLETKTKRMISEAVEIGYIKVNSELESLLLEAKLIKMFLPKYNIIAKDDKHPLYIVITKDKFPIIKTLRKIDLNKTRLTAYYGPFPSSGNVKSVLKMIRRIFPYSDHKLGKRACLYSQIGLCNPCPNEIVHSSEYLLLRKKYLENIRHIKAILDGRIDKVKRDLIHEMNKESTSQNYEKAIEIRNKIKRLDYITNKNLSPDLYLENPNLYEDQRLKESKELANILRQNGLLIQNLRRIECFDIAHLQGTGGAASMVTFIDGIPDKKYYRHFKINQGNKRDDYASMNEIAGRRIRHLNDWGKPDLIIVDGGKGQLGVFLKNFENTGIPIIGLAKKFETLVLPGLYLGAKTTIEYRLPKGPSLYLVERIRDEAHRFAQSYHHKLFERSLFENS